MTALAEQPTQTMPAWATRRRPERENDLAEVEMIAEALGMPLLGWQKEAAALITEKWPNGNYAYTTIVMSVPRRAGKTALVVALMLLRMMRGHRTSSSYLAQQGRDSVELFRETVDAIGDSPALRGKFKAYLAQGSESLTCLATQGKARFLAPTRKSGHGRSNNFVIYDEAWGIDEENGRLIEIGLIPTLATRANSQLIITSAAGDLRSGWWSEWVAKAQRAAELDFGGGLAGMHWGDDSGPYNEPETWYKAHPALGTLIPEQFLTDQLGLMAPEDFSRAFLNRRVTSISRAIPAAVWDAAKTSDGIPRQAKVCFGIDIAADRSASAIVAAAEVDGKVHLELVEQAAGTNWVAGRMREIASRNPHNGIIVDPIGPAATIADALGDMVTLVNMTTMITACSKFMDGLVDGTIVHRGDPALDIAVESAVQRKIGDSGWAWGRTKSAGSIAPLVAATLAAWQATHVPKPKGRAKVF